MVAEIVINDVCADYSLANGISIVQKIFELVCILVPILLIVSLTISLVSYISNPDRKGGFKLIFIKGAAAILIFFLPSITNVVMNLLPDEKFSVAACWKLAAETKAKITKANYTYGITTKSGSLYGDLSGLKKYKDKNSNASTTDSTGKGKVLLIAGHSYPPYCEQKANECRGKLEYTGYDETEETRTLVTLIKKELDKLNLEADIANQLLAGSKDSKMNRSFYVECSQNTNLCKQFNWHKYKYVLEVHFNATLRHNATGTTLVKVTNDQNYPIDQEIVKAVTKHTKGKQNADFVTGIFDIHYFRNQNIPITYLETEFYDVKTAMDKYAANKEKIAKSIAQAIKKYYG